MAEALSPFSGGRFRVTSPYGWRGSGFHSGVDLVGLGGDVSVRAVRGGRVVRSRIVTDKKNRTWEWGNYVAVLQDDGLTAYYCHLASRRAAEGGFVKAGDILGVMGDTGLSYGAHLHFEVRRGGMAVDPAEYLGIENAVGEAHPAIAPAKTDPAGSCADEVCRICGLERQTRDYIDAYKYAKDLWRKIFEHIRG